MPVDPALFCPPELVVLHLYDLPGPLSFFVPPSVVQPNFPSILLGFGPDLLSIYPEIQRH
jgi:hypothetical protein